MRQFYAGQRRICVFFINMQSLHAAHQAQDVGDIMAKMTYTMAVPQPGLGSFYDTSAPGFFLFDATNVILMDGLGAQIVVTGFDIAWDDYYHYTPTGTVTQITFFDNLGHAVASLTSSGLSAPKLFSEFVETGIAGLTRVMLAGNDRISGSAQDNVLFGERGNDKIYAAGGNDVVSGGFGDDAIFGGAGDDRLQGNQGNDTMTGGAGADEFVYTNGFSITITDFHDIGNAAEDDTILISKMAYRLRDVYQDGADTVISLGTYWNHGPSFITIKDFDMINLDRADFTLI